MKAEKDYYKMAYDSKGRLKAAYMVKKKKAKKKSYHQKLGEMISKVKAETKWKDIFRIVEKAQKRINEAK